MVLRSFSVHSTIKPKHGNYWSNNKENNHFSLIGRWAVTRYCRDFDTTFDIRHRQLSKWNWIYRKRWNACFQKTRALVPVSGQVRPAGVSGGSFWVAQHKLI